MQSQRDGNCEDFRKNSFWSKHWHCEKVLYVEMDFISTVSTSENYNVNMNSAPIPLRTIIPVAINSGS